MEASRERNIIVLTDRRLIRLSGAGTSFETAFIALEDAQVAEVRLTSRGKKPLLRVALLLAGAIAALLTIDFPPVALPVAAVLGLAGGYHLFEYLKVSRRGSIHFRTGREEVEIPFRGDIVDQAYAFVNRFFQLKASSPSPAPEAGEAERLEPEALHHQAWQETDGSLDEENEPGVPRTHV